MDYKKHYDLLIEKAKHRKLSEYKEKHHIIPRCMGGTDNKDNLVDLTPEEHYVAHQLLVKMHPNHQGLIWAALQMTGHSSSEGRANNKLYGWLRRKHQKVAKSRIGDSNGSYGRSWYYDPVTLKNGKFLDEEVPAGWLKGRVPKPKCMTCDIEISVGRKYCKSHAPRKRKNTNHVNSECEICGESIHHTSKRCVKHRNIPDPETIKRYEAWWDEFKNSKCKSVREFVKNSENCNISVQALARAWKRHIPEYKTERGKAAKQNI